MSVKKTERFNEKMPDNEKIIEKNDALSCYIMITMSQNVHLERATFATVSFPF